MNTTKYKIWDNEKKEWFRPTYPRNKQVETEEILFSQSGEMYLHKTNLTTDLLIHLPEMGRFTPCRYTEVKDNNDEKVYEFDIVRSGSRTGRVIMSGGCWMIDWDPIHKDEIEILAYEVDSYFLKRRGFTRTGSSLEDASLLKREEVGAKH